MSILDEKIPFLEFAFTWYNRPKFLSIQVYKGAIYVNNETLHKDIEKLRKKMIEIGLSKGFTSEETIKLSKKLDNLINLQMGILRKIYA